MTARSACSLMPATATHDIARFKGSVVRYEKPLDPAEALATRLLAMMEIYNSNELPGIAVALRRLWPVAEAATDEEGYFDFELPIDQPLPLRTAWE